MRNWVLSACLALALPCGALAQRPPEPDKAAQNVPSQNKTSQPNLAGMLEAKVRAAWAAFKNRDKDAYAEFLTDDFQAVEADGDGERSKPRVLREVEHNCTRTICSSSSRFSRWGPNYAFVTYESTVQFPAGSAARYRRIFIGELWTLRDGQWKMLRYQETPVR